ncbi:MAG: 16S rRNA (cytidine(1402)-2'-O)-methyltransferase [Gemmatimonadota bacterium]
MASWPTRQPVSPLMGGTLYIVATPLGNLGDITLRAADLLRTVGCVAAEDTRHTRQLLHHLDAHPRLISFHEHSAESRFEDILGLLAQGTDVAVVSDAGTPVISDPGAELVSRVREMGHRVVPIPGVSAVTAALSASGFPGDRYIFLGFPPRKGKERARFIEKAVKEPVTVLFFEAPGRLVGLLTDLAQAAEPGRPAVVAREITKLHEEIRAGTLDELVAHFSETEPRGEITVVLAGFSGSVEEDPALIDVEGRGAELLAEGMTRRDVVQRLVEETGLPRNEVYRRVPHIPS